MQKKQTIHTDLLIIGGGIAGLRAAIEAENSCKVILITKGKIGESATQNAQGGIAAAIDKIQDSTELHFKDTLAAGAGLCDPTAVRVLVNEGVDRVVELIRMGAQFDRAETEGGTEYSLAMEGAHKRRRILHAGDATGKEIERTLGSRVVKNHKVKILPFTLGIDLLIHHKICFGARVLDINSNQIINLLARATLIATGGAGQAYLHTTNPEVATGDGIAMAYRAGAKVKDMEFIQFHPTALVAFKKFEDIVALPRFLISEAVRGEGAKLLNRNGERFMEKYHHQKELAPRDIVSRAIFAEMEKTKSDHVWLSLKSLGAAKIKKRFPTIYRTCLERGLDITKQNIPVAPAAHYFMGGIKTDLNGLTNISGLFAAGEAASLGIHGANRLASNSLLDGLVFGKRAAESAVKYIRSTKKIKETTAKMTAWLKQKTAQHDPRIKSPLPPNTLHHLRLTIKTILWHAAGIIRNGKNLKAASKQLETINRQLNYPPNRKDEIETKNLALVAKLIVRAAEKRTESRGAHFREDFP